MSTNIEWRKHTYTNIKSIKKSMLELRRNSALTKAEINCVNDVIIALEHLKKEFAAKKAKNQVKLPDGKIIYLQIVNNKEIKKLKGQNLLDYLNNNGYFVDQYWFPNNNK